MTVSNKKIKFPAINLINQFLQVKIDRRMSANKGLQHPWFSEVNLFTFLLSSKMLENYLCSKKKDLDLYSDLTALETKLNQKWLITNNQQEKWNKMMSEADSVHL